MSRTLLRVSLAAMIAALVSQRAFASDPPMSETVPLDLTIVQNQPIEIVRPNFFDLTHTKLLQLSGVLAGPAPGSLAVYFDWTDPAGAKHTSPVQEFPFVPGGTNLVDAQYVIPYCPQEVSVDFRLATADVVRFVGEFTHTCQVPEPGMLLMAGLSTGALALVRRRRSTGIGR